MPRNVPQKRPNARRVLPRGPQRLFSGSRPAVFPQSQCLCCQYCHHLLGPRAALVFRHALNKEVIFTEDAEVISDILNTSRVLANSTTKLASRLTQSLSLSVGFIVMYDSKPAAGKMPTDTALTVGVAYA